MYCVMRTSAPSLYNVYRRYDTVFLEDCLSFFTGARKIPPTRFIYACTLTFNNVNIYPTASTCALILTLPTQYYESYSVFKQKMLFALLNHGGFGLLYLLTIANELLSS